LFPGKQDPRSLQRNAERSGSDRGVGYQVTDRLISTLLMKGASDLTDLSSGLLETRLKLGYRLTGRAGVEGFLAAGLTSGSPDFGAGLSMSYDF
jgi:hypothetical protein